MSYLSLHTGVSLRSSHWECVQGWVESLLGFRRKYQSSLNRGEVTDVDWLASQYPLVLHSHLRTVMKGHLACSAELKLVAAWKTKRRKFSVRLARDLSLNSFAGSESKESFLHSDFSIFHPDWIIFF